MNVPKVQMAQTKSSFHRISKRFDSFEGNTLEELKSRHPGPLSLLHYAVISLVKERCRSNGLTNDEMSGILESILSRLGSQDLDTTSKSHSLNILCKKLETLTHSVIETAIARKENSSATANCYRLPGSDIKYYLNRYQKCQTEFKQLDLLGKGGYGAVFKVQHTVDGETYEYAVKKISLKKKYDCNSKLFREVHCLSQLDHPNVVKYHDAWVEVDASAVADMTEQEEDHQITSKESSALSSSEEPEPSPIQQGSSILFLQMELCSRTLQEWLQERNQSYSNSSSAALAQFQFSRISECTESAMCSTQAGLCIFKQVIVAIEYIHNKGMIHRDIKPGNIFLKEENGHVQAKLGDFGLARNLTALLQHQLADCSLDDVSLVEEEKAVLSQAVGTRKYAAPEQLHEDVYSQKCDMYSLGVVLCELLHPCGTTQEFADVMRTLKSGEIPTYFDLTARQAAKLVQQLTKVNPVERPTATELLETPVLRETENNKHFQ